MSEDQMPYGSNEWKLRQVQVEDFMDPDRVGQLASLALERLQQQEAEIIKLQAFKDFVHRRLDEMGIPSHPDGEHSKAGCRIGDRLDLVEQALRKGVQQWAEPAGECCPKCGIAKHPVLGAKCMTEDCPGKA